MNLDEIATRVTRIFSVRYDAEAAHVEQDELYEAVLTAIAEGAENPAALATEALKARDIKFSRWYA